MPTNPFQAIAPLTRLDNSVYMLMATHILIHWVFPTPREGKSLPEPYTQPEPFNLITEICIGGIEASRRDEPEIIRLHTFSTMQQFASDIVPCLHVCRCTREKSRKTLFLSQQRRGRTAWFEERFAGLANWSLEDPSLLSSGQLSTILITRPPKTFIRTAFVGRRLKVLSFCDDSPPTSRIMLRGMGGRERERAIVKERKTPKHKQQN